MLVLINIKMFAIITKGKYETLSLCVNMSNMVST